MPGRIITILLLSLCFVPLHLPAAEVEALECPGDEFGVRFLVTQERIISYTLFHGEEVQSIGRAVDLAYSAIYWDQGSTVGNSVSVQTRDGTAVMFNLNAGDWGGYLQVGSRAEPISCQWQRS